MSKKITFVARDPYGFEVAPRPYPASQAIPQWWKDAKPYEVTHSTPNAERLVVENYQASFSFKKCTPMLDALTSGYIIPLWTDVMVEQKEFPQISWKIQSSPQGVFTQHAHSSQFVETPVGYTNNVFKYMNPWIPKTPPGYSVLITSPIGYRNLPFQAIPAVIDSDVSEFEAILPVWLKEGFEGVVEKGTPMAQVIPFKRTNWEAEFTFHEEGKYKRIEDKNFNSTIIGHYIKNVWSKKTYK
jgi:hypothetical protein